MECFVFIFALAARKLGTKCKNNYSDNFISSDRYKHFCHYDFAFFKFFFYFLLRGNYFLLRGIYFLLRIHY